MTFALILAAALVTSSAPAPASADPQPIAIHIAAPQADGPSCPASDLETQRQPINFPPQDVRSPLQQICNNYCEDARVLCCADPNEACNYTCAMEFILCRYDCR